MKKNIIGEGQWFRENKLINTPKELIYLRIMDMIAQEQGELAYLLDCKEKNSEECHEYEKTLHRVRAREKDPEKEKMLEKKMNVIKKEQGEILLALQPLFDQKFTQAAKEIPPGNEYNETLRQDVRLDFIFWAAERMHETNQEKKNEKTAEKRKKNKDKVIPPQDHRLITKENYNDVSHEIIEYMRNELARYMTILGLDIKNKQQAKNALEKLFLFILVRTLIEKKLVFETKSLKGTATDGTIEAILRYFEEKIGEPIKVSGIEVKRKLQNNLHDIEGPLDLSYANAMIDDIDYRENYLNSYYLHPHGTSIDDLRREIMAEYDSKKGLIKKSFELLNPMYYAYKQQVEQHKKHLGVLKGYQRKNIDADPELEEIIKEMEQSLAYAQKKKEEYTIIEDDLEKLKPVPEMSLGEIQKRYFKRYRIPTQFHQIFGVVIDKLNNFYKTKLNLIKEADKNNDMEFERYKHSPQTIKEFHLYMQLLCTNKKIDQAFATKRESKRSDRKQLLKNICLDPERIIKQEKLKEAKKTKQIPIKQLSLDLK